LKKNYSYIIITEVKLFVLLVNITVTSDETKYYNDKTNFLKCL